MPANIGAELQALPLEYMLASPLTAAIKAQALAAVTTVDFIEKVGLSEDTAGELSVRTATFTFSQPVPDPANPGAFISQPSTLTVPILTLAPIPFIRISDLNVSFEFKIRDVSSSQSKFEITGKTGFESATTATGSLSGGGLLSFLGASVSGSVQQKTTVTASVSATYQQSNRQMTDRSATFKMTMNAVQDALPEGTSRVLTILSDAIKSQKK